MFDVIRTQNKLIQLIYTLYCTPDYFSPPTHLMGENVKTNFNSVLTILCLKSFAKLISKCQNNYFFVNQN